MMPGESFAPAMEKLRGLWGEDPPVDKFEDFLSLETALPDGQFVTSRTHVFGDDVAVLPYHDSDNNVRDADGVSYPRGDIILSDVIRPGEVAYMMRHHRPMMRRVEKRPKSDEVIHHDGRTLRRPQDVAQMRAHLKLQDTHIGLLIGVADRDGQGHPGVVAVHNPQCYPTGKERVDKRHLTEEARQRFGRFGGDGDEGYSMVVFKPRFPASMTAAQSGLVGQFTDNIRTMAVGFNAVADYPFDAFDGADPLASHDVAGVRDHCGQMIRAIAGDDAATSWFKAPENLIYCSELAHLATSAGLHCPLNAPSMAPLVGQDVWNRFADAVTRHNAGEVTRFRSLNRNQRVRDIELTIADESLRPVSECVDDPMLKPRAETRLAFPALTAEGIARFAMAELLGDAPMASAQARSDPMALIRWLSPEFDGESRGLDDAADLEELLFAKARPGEDPADCLFVPPTLFHLVAKGRCKGGILDLEYVGHGLHFSLVRRSA